jgi:hypothetical protein
MEHSMDRRTFLFGAVAATAGAGFSIPQAEAANWVFLGSRRVNGFVDVDTIYVGGNKQFSHIKLVVRGNSCRFFDLDVTYGNGGHDDIPIRAIIPQGGQTRAIDLKGVDRRIRKVTFKYGRVRVWRGPTFIELWGRKV